MKKATKAEQERKVHESSAFLAGYKPALSIRPSFRYFDYLKKNYPFIDEQDKQQNHLFFQTNDLKELFLSKTEGMLNSGKNPEYARELGIVLGFPKRSVQYFVECLIKENNGTPLEELNQGKIGVWYAGISFATHIDLFIDEVKWLWDTYDHPFARECLSFVEAGIDSVYRLDYGNEDKLELLEEILRKELDLTPVA